MSDVLQIMNAAANPTIPVPCVKVSIRNSINHSIFIINFKLHMLLYYCANSIHGMTRFCTGKQNSRC